MLLVRLAHLPAHAGLELSHSLGRTRSTAGVSKQSVASRLLCELPSRLLVVWSGLKTIQVSQVVQRVFATKLEVCAGERAMPCRERGSSGNTHDGSFAAPSTQQLGADHR